MDKAVGAPEIRASLSGIASNYVSLNKRVYEIGNQTNFTEFKLRDVETLSTSFAVRSVRRIINGTRFLFCNDLRFKVG